MDIASINPKTDYGLNEKEQYLWDQLDEAERVTDLDLDVFDDVEVDYTLPENVPAATQHSGNPLYNNTTLKVNENFFYLPEAEQNHILTHEGVHGNMFNGTLDDQLLDLGLSEDSVEFFNEKMNSTEDEMEGATQYITQLLDPNSERISLQPYPYETQRIRNEAKNEGVDVESELAQEIEDYTNSIIDEFADHEVYGVEFGPSYSIQYGQVNGMDYSIMEIYGDEPEALLEDEEEVSSDLSEEINDYITEITEKYDEVAEYLSEGNEYEMEYGEGANYVGNIDQGHQVPLSASMGTPVDEHKGL